MRRLACVLVLSMGLVPAGGASPGDLPGPQQLASLWDAERLPLPVPPLVRHPDVLEAIEHARASAPGLLKSEQIGESVEGRSINHLWFGHGPLHLLLWSQMHGDEPTATVALFDILEHIRRHRAEPYVERLLDRLTVHMVPMLNPDGAERFQRRNAQGIDINRDALLLQTPEGRALKALRDRLNPPIGFNLHNQNWRTSTGEKRNPAVISLLSVAYDQARSENAGRVRTKKICSVIRDVVETLAPGMVGRYDDEFEVRAFGDNLTKWGTSVVLIETGAYPGPEPDRMLVRLNVVAILTALDALASGRVDRADPARYESLPYNGSQLLHTVIRNATIAPGTGVPGFRGDIGIAAARVIRESGGERRVGLSARIDDLGDLRVFGALDTIDAAGLTAAPLWRPDLKEGDEVSLPQARAAGPYLLPGQPASVVLLKPAPGVDRYVVTRVVRVE